MMGEETHTLMKATFLSYLKLFELYYHTVHYLSCFTRFQTMFESVFQPTKHTSAGFCHDFAYNTSLYVHLLQMLVYCWSNNYILNTVHKHKLVVDFSVLNVHHLHSYFREIL